MIGVVRIDSDLRTVVPGQFSILMGVAILKSTLFTVHTGALLGFDSATDERTIGSRSIPGGAGSFYEPTSLLNWNDDNLVLLSFEIYDPFSETLKLTTFISGTIDVQPFNDGFIVTDYANGTVILASGDDFTERQGVFVARCRTP